jgi:hypothetical protein
MSISGQNGVGIRTKKIHGGFHTHHGFNKIITLQPYNLLAVPLILRERLTVERL